MLATAAALAYPADARAQSRATTAELTGVIVDALRAALPGASVTASDPTTGLTREILSGADGRFVIPALPPGNYHVRAELPGFEPFSRAPVMLTLGTSVDLEIVLAIARVEERVTVVADSRVEDAATGMIAETILQPQIETLPINVRNFISFSLLTRGVAVDRTPQQGVSATSGLTFGGQRGRSNNITVDGVDNNDSVVGSVRATFSQEAVREFQVLSGAYSAEFGKASGGVVNIVTKSGTNTVQANAFGFFRNESLSAKQYFERFNPAGQPTDRAKAPYSQVQYGGTVGGPVRRDRAFYFLSFERLAIDASNFVTIDDTAAVVDPRDPTVILGTQAGILRTAGFPIETGDGPFAVKATQFLGKVDYQPQPTHRLALRFNLSRDRNENIEPFGGQVARSRAAAIQSRDYMLAGSHPAVLSNRSANELRVLVASRDQQINALDPTCDGLCDGLEEGGPTLEVTGVASVGRQRFTPQPRDNVRTQVVETFSYYTGHHHIKAGGDFSWVGTRQTVPLHFGGRYIFAGQLTLPLVPDRPAVPVSSIQAVALGLPAAYVQGYGDATTRGAYQDLSLFLQDDWQLRPRVTLTAGLRYQRQFWPDITYVVPGIARPYSYPADRNDLAPRIGVAWTPTADRRTSVHGSYGVFYDNQITGIAAITDLIDGNDDVRTVVLPAPAAWTAWAAPGRQLSETAAAALVGGSFASTILTVSPALKTPFAHHVTAGVDHELPFSIRLSASALYIRGFNQPGTIDYNPIIAPGGRRPEDVNGVPGTSASVLQYTSFGQTWYRGLLLSLEKRFDDRWQWLASYTLSQAEDTSTDFQSAFVPQNNGRGRNPDHPGGLPLGFDPEAERGPSVQAQRHRLVLSGLYVAPANVRVSVILAAASGRPYNILAGADLNGDGNGGAFPPDRARRDPANESTAVGRNSATLPAQVTLDLRISRRFGTRRSLEAMLEIFNLTNRANFTDVQNIFGPGSYPSQPGPTFGQYTQAGSPVQAQLGLRLSF
ncbi:MAG: TonB-dependent receptor [Acidobacteria bacterium]|nr:TonB-dependent receptor [Acidobacteriota bacterium]